MIATARLEKPQRYQIFDEDHRRRDRRQVHRTVVYKVGFDKIRGPACRGGNAGGQKGGRGIDGTDRMKTILVTGGGRLCREPRLQGARPRLGMAARGHSIAVRFGCGA
jgi:hypothetical protein